MKFGEDFDDFGEMYDFRMEEERRYMKMFLEFRFWFKFIFFIRYIYFNFIR